MFPLTHLYMNRRILGRMNPPLALGSVLPDVLSSLGMPWEESHRMKPCCLALHPEVRLGDSLHGIGLPGLDYYTDRCFLGGPGYAFRKAGAITPRMAALGLPERDLIWRGHNQVEMAIEVSLGRTHRHLFSCLQEAREDRELLEHTSLVLEEAYGVRGDIAAVLDSFILMNADSASLGSYYSGKLNRIYRLETTGGQIREIIRAAWQEVRPDHLHFLNYCQERITSSLKRQQKIRARKNRQA